MSSTTGNAASARGAMLRFSFMAKASGVMSLLLWFLYLPARHLLTNQSLYSHVRFIALVHGFIYPIYVLAAFHYCLKMRKPLATTIFYILAGTLPVASFIADRRALAEYKKLAL
jgi:integral membrane protein